MNCKGRVLGCLLFLVNTGAFAQELSFRPLIGGLPADSGIAFGFELSRPQIAGPVDARIQALFSVKRYQFIEGGFQVPRFGARWLDLEISGRYRNYPEEDFWGIGPNTAKDRRSNFRMEDIGASTALIFLPAPGLRTGVSAGFLNVHIGDGRDKDVPATQELFLPAGVPGIDRQPNYWNAAVFLEYDTRDVPGDPQRGGNYAFRWTRFSDWNGSRFGFNRYTLDLQQFLPIADGQRLGARLQTIFTAPVEGQVVPFFMLPTAGGTDTVRGFHQYRFRDANAMILNAEYRRTLAGFFDAIAFADAGRVFTRAGDLGFRDLHASGGFGSRIRFGRFVFFGADVGFSREGTRLWFRGGHTF